MKALNDLLAQSFLGNSVQTWLEAAGVFILLLIGLPLLRRLVLGQLKKTIPQHPSPTFRELLLHLLQRTLSFFFFAVAVYAALKMLDLPHRVDRGADVVIQLIVWLQVGLWGVEAVGFFIDRRMPQVTGEHAPTLGILRFVSLLVIWAVALLMLLSNLGVNITTLVTGLGIGGVAVALAVQNVLGDLLASLSIAFDKPFVVGDLLRLDDLTGRVESIGIKSTRLRSVEGDQVIISNAQLLSSRVHNLGRTNQQRVMYVFGVAPDTAVDKLRQIPSILERLVSSLPGAKLDHCYFRGFGNGALEFEVTFYVSPPDRLAIFEVQQQFNLRLLERFAVEGITLNTAGATRAPPQKAPPAPAPKERTPA